MSDPITDAFADPRSIATIKQELAKAMAWPLPTDADVAAFNLLDLGTLGVPYQAVLHNGYLYEYAAGDSTTAHDPAAGCIVSGDSRRYIRAVNPKPDHAVLDKDLTAPPGGEDEGDAYYVATGATGAWATRDGDVALWTGRGWTFRTVNLGDLLHVADEDCYYHMPASGTLTKGMGDLALGNAVIELKHLADPSGIIVQATQNTPPVSPSDRIKYIVGSTPTGAWTSPSQAGKIAEWDDDLEIWVFHSPGTGWRVWDVAAGYQKVWSGSAWAAVVTVPTRYDEALFNIDAVEDDNEGAGWSVTTTFAYYDLVTISITGESGQQVLFDLVELTIEMKLDSSSFAFDPSSRLYIRKDTESTLIWEDQLSNVTNVWGALASGANFLALDAIADGSAHDYHIGIYVRHQSSTDVIDDIRLTVLGEVYRTTLNPVTVI